MKKFIKKGEAMMQSSKNLQPVASLAKQKERSAARHHGSVLQELQQVENQLDELVNYRNQYLDLFKTASETGLSSIQLQDYRLFLRRLDDAINQQQQHLQSEQQNCENSREKWVDKRNRSKMINKAVENRQQAEKQQADKREQRAIEDLPKNNNR